MSLIGAAALSARLRALAVVWRPISRDWAAETVVQAKRRVPRKTGRLQRSIKVTRLDDRRAVVEAHYTAYFIDSGTKAHDEPKRRGTRSKRQNKAALVFTGRGGNTIFAKKVHHPKTRAQPFREESAKEAIRRHPLGAQAVLAWNKGAQGIPSARPLRRRR